MTTPSVQGPRTDALARGSLDEGRVAFAARDVEAAHQAFERAHRRDTGDPAIMSWYGLTLVLVEKNWTLGLTLCEQALRTAGPEPELLLNQARAHLALNQRERAVRSILRGLELWPDDPRLVAARIALGTRSPPVLGFLSRRNPLNRVLGRIRYRWRQRRTPFHELSPVALGVPATAPGGEPGS